MRTHGEVCSGESGEANQRGTSSGSKGVKLWGRVFVLFLRFDPNFEES
jgi:hypothetical protein